MVMLNTIKHLNRDRFEIHIAAGAIDPSLSAGPELSDSGLKIFLINSLVRDISAFKDVAALIRLYLLIKKEQYDIVHCHTSKAGFVGRAAARMANVNTILYSPHGNIFSGYFGSLSTKLFIALEKIAAKFTDRIITLTKRGIDPYIERGIGIRKQYKHIYNGIDVNAFTLKGLAGADKKREELGLNSRQPTAAVVGRLVPVKGHARLIEAFRKVVDTLPDAALVVAGDGPLRGELVNRAKEIGLEANIKFLGMRNDVAEIIAAVDLLVLPSINEGFGIVLIEAMALKKPVVASNVDGVPEIVDDDVTGLLAPPEDCGAFAAALIKLFNDKELAHKMGQKGFKKAVKEFDIQATAKNTEELYYEQLRFLNKK